MQIQEVLESRMNRSGEKSTSSVRRPGARAGDFAFVWDSHNQQNIRVPHCHTCSGNKTELAVQCVVEDAFLFQFRQSSEQSLPSLPISSPLVSDVFVCLLTQNFKWLQEVIYKSTLKPNESSGNFLINVSKAPTLKKRSTKHAHTVNADHATAAAVLCTATSGS